MVYHERMVVNLARLFGTDGIRGIANVSLTAELAFDLGKAVAVLLKNDENLKPKFIIGKDTRISGDMLEASLSAGLCASGADVVSVGVVPTPAVAVLVKKYKADAGIMISASHNTYEYNGIKIFSADGFKLPDELEERIEAILHKEVVLQPLPTHGGLGMVSYAKNPCREYIDYVKCAIDNTFEGMNIAIDCANGSSCVTAQTLFTEMGATCHMLANKPDGVNINENCGSTHMEKLVEYVKVNKLDMGLAFDGDADRFLCVDDKGEIMDGDEIMALCALDMKSRGVLAKNTLVGTIMSNLGLIKFCEENGINYQSTKVGDRYVLDKMQRHNYSLGGEQSGHVIFLDYITTGDGQLTALKLLSIVKRRESALSSLRTCMRKYPQTMININISAEGKISFYTNSKVKKSIENAMAKLGDTGRIVVRPSGTEPLVRVMVEGESEEFIYEVANEVADVIRTQLT